MSKKIIPPIIIGILICLFLCSYIFYILYTGVTGMFFVIPIIVLISLVILTMFVVKERIKEIESGEEDDLSKYWLHYR